MRCAPFPSDTVRILRDSRTCRCRCRHLFVPEVVVLVQVVLVWLVLVWLLLVAQLVLVLLVVRLMLVVWLVLVVPLVMSFYRLEGSALSVIQLGGVFLCIHDMNTSFCTNAFLST